MVSKKHQRKNLYLREFLFFVRFTKNVVLSKAYAHMHRQFQNFQQQISHMTYRTM